MDVNIVFFSNFNHFYFYINKETVDGWRMYNSTWRYLRFLHFLGPTSLWVSRIKKFSGSSKTVSSVLCVLGSIWVKSSFVVSSICFVGVWNCQTKVDHYFCFISMCVCVYSLLKKDGMVQICGITLSRLN